ncbi:MAG TPA: helicase-exonuclease AddAB subunit AddB [Bacillales bacterium]|nr:helicase-exonuclease AddAB subunit AddB [Bacillales bacterium]
MSLRFMLGRAGSGKTSGFLGEVRDKLRETPEGSLLVMVVPDQMTFETEYRLAAENELGGMTRAQVFSFGRLALNVLQQVGGVTRGRIDSVGINMMLRNIVEARKSELKVFQRASDQQGFYELLEEMMTELKRYQFTPEDLDQTLGFVRKAPDGGKSEVLADKLHDLRLIFGDMEAALAGKYIDAEDSMRLLAEKIPLAPGLRDAEVWVDGFYSFTPQEMAVLEALMKHCRRVTIGLTLDRPYENELPDETALFRPTAATYQKLCGIAAEADVEIEEPLVLSEAKRFSGAALAHLEANFEKRPPEQFLSEKDEVVVSQAVNRRSEVEGAAREILRLVREEELRFRDVAVLVRDMGTYHDLMETIFEDHGIPIFLDQKRTMLHHPLMEFIRSSLDVIEQNWRYEAVFRCVKTDMLFPPEAGNVERLREEMDELENYVLAHGIHGGRWTDGKSWRYRRYRGLDDAEGVQTDEEKKKEARINELRGMIVTPLSRLERDLKGAKTARERCEALYLYLEALEVPQKIEKWRNRAEEEGRLAEAREHDQVWTAVIGLLDQMVEMVGDQVVKPDVFVKMIETGLDSMKFSLVPPALDQVLVGSLDRTRSVDVKSVLILGANDGVLPAKPKEDGMLSEEERELLEVRGIELAPGSRQRLLEEELLMYLALAGAKERLWVSYPLADEEGKALQPSLLINRLKAVFPELEEKLIMSEPEEATGEEALEYVSGPQRGLVYTLGQVRQWRKGYPIPPVWWDVYNWLAERPEWQVDGRRLFSGLFYKNKEKRLSPETSRSLYGDKIQASVSRMERFSSCPFQQFASHGLRLKERETFRLEAPDIGQLFHSALSLMADHVRQTRKNWGELSDAECERLAGQFVDGLIPKLQREILLSSNRHHYIARKLKSVVSRTATILRDHAKASGFSPVGLELPFGPKEQLPPIQFELANGTKMEIVGRIDRIDAAEGSNGLLLRVIDYKSSATSLGLTEVYFGLALQMLTYLDVVLTHAGQWLGREASPAGVLYFHVHNPMLQESQALTPEAIEQKLFKEFKMNGLVLAEEETVRLMDGTLENGHSNIVPAGLKKNGEFYSNSSVAAPEQFSDIRKYVRRVIQNIGTDLTDGMIDIAPYRLKDRTPCTFCSYRPVCQFDPSMETNDYRWLRKEKDDVMLKKMLEGREDDETSEA